MKWDGTPKTSPVTSIYNPDHAGWAPKPTWLLTRSQSGLRTGSYPGAKAKDVWKPPGKGQRSVMVKSYEPEEPPLEFMELYTDVNNDYKDKMLALRMFMFRRYVEPTLVEEEAFAQLQGMRYTNMWPLSNSAKILELATDRLICCAVYQAARIGVDSYCV